MHRKNLYSALLCVAVFVASAACSNKEKSYDKFSTETLTLLRVTGIPDENPTELARAYQPMVELLTDRLGIEVEYVPVTDYGAAVQALAAGKVDVAWLGGFTHVQSRNMAKVVPLVMRDIDKEFHSAFIANTESGITEVAGAKGKKFAFGSKSSTSGHLMPRHFLLSEFKIDAETDFDGMPVFSGAHDATVKIVESGKVAAGALNMQVWERMVSEGTVDTSKVTLIWTTPPYSDYVWTARTSIPEEIREKFSQAFLDLDPKNELDKQVLDRMGATKYVRSSPSDFDAIEKVAKTIGLLK